MPQITPELIIATREAERALLGCLLVAGAIEQYPMKQVRDIVSFDDFLDSKFYDNKHSRIYKAMLAFDNPNQVNVALEMNRQNILRSGDCGYLRNLVADCVSSLDFMSFAKCVKGYSAQRNGIRIPKYKGLVIN